MQETLELRQALQEIDMIQEIMFGMIILTVIEMVILFGIIVKMNNNADTEV
jgi:hypothetical protein